MTTVPTTLRYMPLRLTKLAWPSARMSRAFPYAAGVAILYFAASKVGLRLAIVHPSATAVWPGTGIALAAILLLGYQVWPGIFVSAFAVNLTTAGSIVSSLGIASGNTLEALLGAYLVTRFANGRRVFDRPEGIFKFFLLACVLATTLSASLGVASLSLTGFTLGMKLEPLWLTWWLGNMAGAILVTPCFLLWLSPREAPSGRRPLLLQTSAIVSLFLVAVIVFGDFLFPNASDYPLKFVCIPFVVWVAFELRPPAAALAILAFSAVSIGSALHAARGISIPNESLLVTQIFLGIVALTSLLVSVTVAERNRHEQTLQRAKSELEERVSERTRELEKRIASQERAELALRGLSARLLETQDQERRRIARELHDSTGQSLAVLTMNLAKISKELEEFRPELAVELSENETIVRAVSDELRTTSYLLHPPLLDEIGLQAGLRWYVEGFKQRSNIEVSLQLTETPQRLPPDLELMLFRVVQECLTNVHRHSGSPTATICLCISQEKLTLEIRDQGKGMTADKLAETAGSGSAGVGLRGMRERVKAFGGELQISSDGTGTLVRALIPFRASVTEAGSSNS
jgi:signal transduction histidine kinase